MLGCFGVAEPRGRRVLEIVERILAALIILALLTLLIILAFPVPPRQTPAPTANTPKSGEVKEAENRTPAKTPEKTAEQPKEVPPPAKAPEQPARETRQKVEVKDDSRAEREAETRAEERRRAAADEERRRVAADEAEHARRPDRTAHPAADVRDCADPDCRRLARPSRPRDCIDGDCRRRVRPARVRDCSEDSDDCSCDEAWRRRYVKRHNLPYWAQPPRRYAARDDDPDWYDERARDPGPPPGTCPD